MAGAEHWDAAWRGRAAADTSWFEGEPIRSLELVLEDGPPASVVDLGAGQSTLVDHLLEAGCTDVTLVDVAAEPLEVVRARLGDRPEVAYVVADVRSWVPGRRFACWHDRATFHFLTEPADQAAYAELAAASVEPSGRLLVATFATDGPDTCSGLTVARRDPEGLVTAFAGPFRSVRVERQRHVTPWGDPQEFLWGVFVRV